MDIKNITIGGAVLAALIACGLWFSNAVEREVEQPPVRVGVGYEARSDITVGGVTTYYFAQTMTQGASTTCQWQTPAATSTVRLAARFTLASTSAVVVDFGKSPIPYATTTITSRHSIAASTPSLMVSTTSPSDATGIGDVIDASPSTWIVVKMGGGGVGSVPTGTCNFSAELLP